MMPSSLDDLVRAWRERALKASDKSDGAYRIGLSEKDACREFNLNEGRRQTYAEVADELEAALKGESDG